MIIMALDTASDYCAVSLRKDNTLLAERIVMTTRDQAKILAPLTQQVLQDAGIPLSAIDRFCIATGPGSFTGLRVGLSFAQGLAFAAHKPLLGFDHFRVMQDCVPQQAPLLFIRDSKREELYCAWLEHGAFSRPYFLATTQACIGLLKDHPQVAFSGDGAMPILTSSPELASRSIPVLASVFMEKLAGLARAAAEPLPKAHAAYLRDADVTMPVRN